MPKWFPAAAGRPQQDLVSFRHTGWFDAVAEECRAVRERVGILDSTAFAKFDLIGPDAAAVLDRLTTNTVPAVGRIGLTYLLTPQARIESELTVTRIAADHLYLVSAAAGEGKDREFFEAHWPDGADAELVTRSMELGVLNVTGPAARRLLDRVTDADLSNEAFGWLRGRLIAVAGVPDVRALRVGFTGELGWELHLRVEDLATVYDALWAAGTPLGVADGVYADGHAVGLVTSGAYGFHCRQGLAFAYLAPEHAEPGAALDVRVVGDLRPARVLGEAVHDPTNTRLRA